MQELIYIPNLDWLAKESPSNSRNISGRNPSMVVPLLANQDLTPILIYNQYYLKYTKILMKLEQCNVLKLFLNVSGSEF